MRYDSWDADAMSAEMGGHLDLEQLERVARRPAGDGSGEAARHVAACAECRREVTELRALTAMFAALPLLEPAPDFTERVMTRVALRRPWYARAWSAVRNGRTPLLAVLVALAAAGAGVAVWQLRFPQVTPRGVIVTGLEGLRDLVLQGVIALGRVLYEAGWIEGARSFAEGLSVPDAAAGLLTVSLVGIGATLTMIRLLQHSSNGAVVRRQGAR